MLLLILILVLLLERIIFKLPLYLCSSFHIGLKESDRKHYIFFYVFVLVRSILYMTKAFVKLHSLESLPRRVFHSQRVRTCSRFKTSQSLINCKASQRASETCFDFLYIHSNFLCLSCHLFVSVFYACVFVNNVGAYFKLDWQKLELL